MSTVYFIDSTDGTINIAIQPGALNGPGSTLRDSDLRLYGLGTLQWGEGVDENMFRLAETFACPSKVLGDFNPLTSNNDYDPTTDPILPKDETDLGAGNGITNPLIGQLWFNKTSGITYVYDGAWSNVAQIATSTSEPTNPDVGTLWYDTSPTPDAGGCITDPLLKIYYPTHPDAGANGFVLIGENFVRQCGDFMTGELDMGGDDGGVTNKYKIINLQEPTANSDAATKFYVDNIPVGTTLTPDQIAYLNGLNLPSLTPAETNFSDGVTSNIQTQLDDKASNASVALKADITDLNLKADITALNLKVDRAGDTMTGPLFFDTHLFFDEGNGNSTVAPDIRATGNLFVTATDSTIIAYDNDNNSNGSFVVTKGGTTTSTDTDIFQITNNGTIRSHITSYETLVLADNDIPNKKYVDDAITASAGSSIVGKTIGQLTQNGSNNFMTVVNGRLHTAAGQNGFLQRHGTGRGSNTTSSFRGVDSGLKEVYLPISISPIKQIGGNGYAVAWALLENGELYAWGLNSVGSTGIGNNSSVSNPRLVQTNVEEVYDHPSQACVDVTFAHTVIRKTDGFLYGTGYNGRGQLALGTLTNHNTFQQMTSFGNSIKGVWNMGTHLGVVVVQKTDDTIWVVGYNGFGQVGNGSTANSISTPINVTAAWGGGAGFELKQVIGGFGHDGNASSVIGMLLDNGVTTVFRIAGHGGFSAMGNGSVSNQSTPVTPNVGTGRIAEVAFVSAIGPVQVLKEDGNLYTWGRSAEGSLGNGTTAPDVSIPFITRSGVIKLFSDGMNSHGNGFRTTAFIKDSANQLLAAGFNANGNGYSGTGSTAFTINGWTRVLLPLLYDIQAIGSYLTVTNGRILIAKGINHRLYAWGYNNNHGINVHDGVSVPAPIQLSITEDNVI